MTSPVEFINLLSTIMTVVIAILLLKMVLIFDVKQNNKKKTRKSYRNEYLGL